MQPAELERRLRRAIRRWKEGPDPQDTNVLTAELMAELADLPDAPRRPPADASWRPPR